MKLIQLGDQSVLEMWIKNCGKKTIVTAPDNSLLAGGNYIMSHALQSITFIVFDSKM